MARLIRVVASPFSHDDGFPWSYGPDEFIAWHDEVFDEGYKKPAPAPFGTLDAAIEDLMMRGYQIEVDVGNESWEA